ncbi:MAG: serine/threonine protein kinase [Solirubrobacteraceae bacterium]
MVAVIVQVPGPGGDPPSHVESIDPGQTLRFGRGAPDRRVDVPLPQDGVARVAGEISAAEDHWVISNFSRDQAYVVDNPEGTGEYVQVAPCRLGAPIPFEFARVSLPATEGPVSFLVSAPAHTYADPDDPEGPAGERTTSAFVLDESAKYFLVLVALCEPRLRDGATVALPTADEVVRRLRSHEDCGELTRTAVNHHIDYLAVQKLHVKDPRPGSGGRLDFKREAVVSTALRFGLVRDEHRRLLPPRPPDPA